MSAAGCSCRRSSPTIFYRSPFLSSLLGPPMQCFPMVIFASRSILVAVGTTIAGAPRHRSVRARLRIRLLFRMSGVEANVRINDAGYGVEESIESRCA
jgi:hypothetical protein